MLKIAKIIVTKNCVFIFIFRYSPKNFLFRYYLLMLHKAERGHSCPHKCEAFNLRLHKSGARTLLSA
jgi:hypothetical protein